MNTDGSRKQRKVGPENFILRAGRKVSFADCTPICQAEENVSFTRGYLIPPLPHPALDELRTKRTRRNSAHIMLRAMSCDKSLFMQLRKFLNLPDPQIPHRIQVSWKIAYEKHFKTECKAQKKIDIVNSNHTNYAKLRHFNGEKMLSVLLLVDDLGIHNFWGPCGEI